MAKRTLKNPIKYKITLDEDQKKAKEAIITSEIVVITGNAGAGKTLLTTQTALDLLFKKEIDKVYVTRAAVEVGRSLGFLKGGLVEKFDPYIEAFKDNMYKCYDRVKVDKHIEDGQVEGMPVQFVRGKTIDKGQILFIEEAQNLTKKEMLALLTRLGKGGRIVISGDNNQSDINEEFTGLHYAIELSKNFEEIPWIKLKSNHRSELVGKILDFEYNTR